MTYFAEKVFALCGTLVASGLMALAALFTEGEVSYLLFTFAVSIFTSVMLAFGFRKAAPMPKVVSRVGFSVLGGVFATRIVAHKFGMNMEGEGALINLTGLAVVVCIVSYFVGWSLLKILDKRGDGIAGKVADRYDPFKGEKDD